MRDYLDAEKFARLMRAKGIVAGHDRRLLRRQEQLVGHVRPLGLPTLRPRTRRGDGRRPEEVGGRGAADDDGRARRIPPTELPGARARRRGDPRLPRRRAGAPASEGPAGRRALPEEFTRREAAHARVPAGRRDARRAHPRRAERSLGARGEPGTGEFRSADELRAIYEEELGLEPRRRRGRLLPHRRAIAATPGSCSRTCSATTTCATTTARGRSGATGAGRRSRDEDSGFRIRDSGTRDQG